jgi:CheY-like chemotaxis protein
VTKIGSQVTPAEASKEEKPVGAPVSSGTRIEDAVTVGHSLDRVWKAFADMPAVAACLPGADIDADGTVRPEGGIDLVDRSDVVPVVPHRRRRGDALRAAARQVVDALALDRPPEREILGVRAGEELAECARVHDRAREEMRARLLALLDDRDRNVPEALRELRKLPETVAVPVIAVTAFAMTDDRDSILFSFAHPDDEAFGVSGTLVRYAAEGVHVEAEYPGLKAMNTVVGDEEQSSAAGGREARSLRTLRPGHDVEGHGAGFGAVAYILDILTGAIGDQLALPLPKAQRERLFKLTWPVDLAANAASLGAQVHRPRTEQFRQLGGTWHV